MARFSIFIARPWEGSACGCRALDEPLDEGREDFISADGPGSGVVL